jgi:lipid A 3-O-deacylase
MPIVPPGVLLTIALELATAASPAAFGRVQASAFGGDPAAQTRFPQHHVVRAVQAVVPSARVPRRTTVALREENDVVGGTDRNYSNGLSLTVAREGSGPLGGIWKRLGAEPGRLVSSYELGQLIMTPADLRRKVPDPTDRPYAGLLYVAASTYSSYGNRFQGLKLITGMVGPASLAAQTQMAFHRYIHSPMPQGWDYQLKNEPILNMVYERRQRFTLLDSQSGWGAEAIPMAGAMLGNVLTQCEADAQFRFGYNVPDDFGTTLMRGLGNLPYPISRHDQTEHRFGVYGFAGGGGNLVARNLTLDGNTFRDGPRVPKKPAFAAGEAGVTVWTRRFKATFTYVVWGKEFVTQARPSRYGAVTIAVHF